MGIGTHHPARPANSKSNRLTLRSGLVFNSWQNLTFRGNALGVPKSHVFLKEPNLLICREMRSGQTTCLATRQGGGASIRAMPYSGLDDILI